MGRIGSALAGFGMLGFVLAGSSAPALAQQTTIGQASNSLFATCRANQQGSASECACASGFFGGAMKDDEFKMMAIIAPFIGKDGQVANMQGAQAAAMAERDRTGMTQARFLEVMQRFVDVGAQAQRADSICKVLANR